MATNALRGLYRQHRRAVVSRTLFGFPSIQPVHDMHVTCVQCNTHGTNGITGVLGRSTYHISGFTRPSLGHQPPPTVHINTPQWPQWPQQSQEGISIGGDSPGEGEGQADSFCSDSSLLDGKFSLTMGWGKKEDGQISKVLREVGMPIISNAQCRQMFR